MLRSRNQKDWNEYFPYLLFAYCEVPQEMTGFSPFGRHVQGPLDVLKEDWTGERGTAEGTVSRNDPAGSKACYQGISSIMTRVQGLAAYKITKKVGAVERLRCQERKIYHINLMKK